MLSLEKALKKSSPGILLSRPDRIGDVVLSTPAMVAVKKKFPKSRLTVIVRPELVDIIGGLSEVNEVISFAPDIHQSWLGVRDLVDQIRNARIDIGIALQSNYYIALALFLARVPVRIGPLSKPHSWVLYNNGIRQKRSEVKLHEADYNLQLLEPLEILEVEQGLSTCVSISSGASKTAEEWLTRSGRTAGKKIVGVHPGMGGSALNWPEKTWIELVSQLLKSGLEVVLSTGPAETELRQRMRSGLGKRQGLYFYGSEETHSLDAFGGLIQNLDLFVAPSTGPLHLAVAIGKPVLSIYPPVRVQSKKRWGPYGTKEGMARVMTPSVPCPAEKKCLEEGCPLYNCMERLSVEEAVKWIREKLGTT